MSCKVLSGDQAGRMPAMAWEHIGSNPAGSIQAPEPSGQRLRELEQASEIRAKQAHDAGFREGEQRGREQGKAEARTVMERMLRSIAEMAELKSRFRREAEADLLELALAIARRILNRQIAVDPEALAGIIRAALDRLKGQEVLRLRVHPAQEAAMRAFASGTPMLAGAAILADPQLESGGAVLETSRGNLDATLDNQLSEIGRGLADLLQRNGS